MQSIVGESRHAFEESSRPTVAVVSRCAWTLHNFRRPLMRALAERGALVMAFGAGGDGYDTRLEAEGFNFEHVRVGMRKMGGVDDASITLQLYERFRRLRPSVVHCFTVRPAIFGTLAAACAGVPVRVVTITGLGHAFTSASSVVRRAVEILYRLALRHADVVFFQNADDRELFLVRGLVDPRRCRLVPGSGIDVERFVPQPLPSLAGEPVTVLMIARLLREKGVREYLEAARLLGQRSLGARFRLLGGLDPRNPSALSRAEITRLASEAGVEWIDQVTDVRPWIAEADLVVLPSYREGLPRSLLEGAAMGRPLVTTDAPGCREVVEEGGNGYLVEVGNAEALAAAIARIAADGDLMVRMGQNSRRLVESRFDERIVIRETLAAYGELLRKKVGHGAAGAFLGAQRD